MSNNLKDIKVNGSKLQRRQSQKPQKNSINILSKDRDSLLTKCNKKHSLIGHEIFEYIPANETDDENNK